MGNQRSPVLLLQILPSAVPVLQTIYMNSKWLLAVFQCFLLSVSYECLIFLTFFPHHIPTKISALSLWFSLRLYFYFLKTHIWFMVFLTFFIKISVISSLFFICGETVKHSLLHS